MSPHGSAYHNAVEPHRSALVVKVMLVIMALAGAIFLVYLGWWFAASVSATFWRK